MNDIYNSSDKLSFYLFGDNTNLLYADKNLRSLINSSKRGVKEYMQLAYGKQVIS